MSNSLSTELLRIRQNPIDYLEKTSDVTQMIAAGQQYGPEVLRHLAHIASYFVPTVPHTVEALAAGFPIGAAGGWYLKSVGKDIPDKFKRIIKYLPGGLGARPGLSVGSAAEGVAEKLMGYDTIRTLATSIR